MLTREELNQVIQALDTERLFFEAAERHGADCTDQKVANMKLRSKLIKNADKLLEKEENASPTGEVKASV